MLFRKIEKRRGYSPVGWLWLILPFVSLFMLSSCLHKELYRPYENVGALNITFDWESSGKDSVQGMSVILFPLYPDGEIWRFEIAGNKGGPVELPYGEYQLVTFNNDVAGVRIVDSHSAATLAAELIAPEGAVSPMPPLYSDFVSFLSFQSGGVEYMPSYSDISLISVPEREIVCRPTPLTTLYEIEIVNVEEIADITRAAFELHGVSDKIGIYDHLPSPPEVSVRDNLIINKEENMLHRTFESFMCVFSGDAIMLDVEFIRQNKGYAGSFDVTRQVLENQNPAKYVKIVIDCKDYSSSGESWSDVGSVVDVDGWNEVVINYNTDNENI